MPSLRQRLFEDRLVRDAARSVVETDIAFIKTDVERRGVASRLLDFGGDSAQYVADGTSEYAEENRGKLMGALAVAAAAGLAWIYRKDLLDLLQGNDEGSPEPEGETTRSHDRTNSDYGDQDE